MKWGEMGAIHLEFNGHIVAKYGDYYHDKGSVKVLGFIDGFAYIKNWKEKVDYTIKYDYIVDENL